MRAVAVGAMTQACNILSNSGTPLNSAGGRNASNANWSPISGPAWNSAKVYTKGDVANGVDGKVYHSLASQNVDHEPSASPGYWSLGFPCLTWRDKIFTTTTDQAGVVQQISRYKIALPLGTPVSNKRRIALIGGPVYEIEGVDGSHANAVQIILDCKLVH
jgi:hypothetical protein